MLVCSQDRFLALYLGGVRDLGDEVSRVTLFFPQNNVGGASVFGVLPTLFCGCLTKPFFIFRPSAFWCVCIKHLVPFVMLVAIVDCKEHAIREAHGFPAINNVQTALLHLC